MPRKQKQEDTNKPDNSKMKEVIDSSKKVSIIEPVDDYEDESEYEAHSEHDESEEESDNEEIKHPTSPAEEELPTGRLSAPKLTRSTRVQAKPRTSRPARVQAKPADKSLKELFESMLLKQSEIYDKKLKQIQPEMEKNVKKEIARSALQNSAGRIFLKLDN